MPRQARALSESGYYHVINRGIGKQILFEDADDNQRFLDTLKRYSEEEHFELICYCLMENHFHLLVHTETGLDRIMKRICCSYAYYYNEKYGRTGHLFQERYRSEAIKDDKQLLATVRYIHNNPQKAGICRREEYAWSSWREYELDAEAASAGVSVQQNPFNISVSREEMCSIALGLTAEKIVENEDGKLKDYEAVTILQTLLPPGVDRMSMKLQSLPIKRTIFKEAISRGIGMRQLSRITDIHLSSISRLLYAKHGDGSSVSRHAAETEEPSPLGGE